VVPSELVRSTDADKDRLIDNVRRLQAHYQEQAEVALKDLQKAAIEGRNLFETLMETTKVATLGQISAALYEVGGQYRRSM
jgi:methylmalonyl-CoA mutase